MQEIELSVGSIEYEDTGGDGPTVVLLHGLLMDATLWTGVVAELATDHRCVVPTLPLGAHRHPMPPDADLSLPGIASLVDQLIDRLDLTDVTLVGNDTGGALVQLVAAAGGDGAQRVGRMVLVSCEAFDNLPPGLTGRTIALAGKLPPRVLGLFAQQMRLKPLRRLPLSFGWLTKRGDPVTAKWLRPIMRHQAIRRDAVRVLRSAFSDKELLTRAADDLAGFGRPALVVWARQDKVMPAEHGRRLADLLSHGRLVEIEDSYTLVPLDQPWQLANHLRWFTLERVGLVERPQPAHRRQEQQ